MHLTLLPIHQRLLCYMLSLLVNSTDSLSDCSVDAVLTICCVLLWIYGEDIAEISWGFLFNEVDDFVLGVFFGVVVVEEDGWGYAFAEEGLTGRVVCEDYVFAAVCVLNELAEFVLEHEWLW